MSRVPSEKDRRCCPVEMERKDLPLRASSLAVSLPMPVLAPVITTTFPGSCTFVPQTPPAKNFLQARETKHLCTILSNPRLRYIKSTQPQRGISFCLSGDLKKLIFSGQRLPSGQGSLLLISSAWEVTCREATNDHVGK